MSIYDNGEVMSHVPYSPPFSTLDLPPPEPPLLEDAVCKQLLKTIHSATGSATPLELFRWWMNTQDAATRNLRDALLKEETTALQMNVLDPIQDMFRETCKYRTKKGITKYTTLIDLPPAYILRLPNETIETILSLSVQPSSISESGVLLACKKFRQLGGKYLYRTVNIATTRGLWTFEKVRRFAIGGNVHFGLDLARCMKAIQVISIDLSVYRLKDPSVTPSWFARSFSNLQELYITGLPDGRGCSNTELEGLLKTQQKLINRLIRNLSPKKKLAWKDTSYMLVEHSHLQLNQLVHNVQVLEVDASFFTKESMQRRFRNLGRLSVSMDPPSSENPRELIVCFDKSSDDTDLARIIKDRHGFRFCSGLEFLKEVFSKVTLKLEAAERNRSHWIQKFKDVFLEFGVDSENAVNVVCSYNGAEIVLSPKSHQKVGLPWDSLGDDSEDDLSDEESESSSSDSDLLDEDDEDIDMV